MSTASPGAFQTITYFVVPLKKGGPMQDCAYYKPGASGWEPVAQDALYTAFGSDYVCIEQPLPADLPPTLQPPPAYDTEARLFSAVAQTLDESSGLPNSFMASDFDGRTRVVLPVARNTTRGVILLFTHSRGGKVLGLRPSDDPEIKNQP